MTSTVNKYNSYRTVADVFVTCRDSFSRYSAISNNEKHLTTQYLVSMTYSFVDMYNTGVNIVCFFKSQ